MLYSVFTIVKEAGESLQAVKLGWQSAYLYTSFISKPLFRINV
jgi:hypothetical protein